MKGDYGHSGPAAASGSRGRCCACGQAIPEYGGITADGERLRVSYGGKTVKLTPTQFEVFRFLLKKAGRLARKESLLDWLYQLKPECDWPEDDKITDVLVCKVRALIEPLGLQIETVWGVGWYLAEPAPPPPAAGPEASDILIEVPAVAVTVEVLPAETVANTVTTESRDTAKRSYASRLAASVGLMKTDFPAKKRGSRHGRG